MFTPTPVSLAKQQVLQRCVSDGMRIGLGLPFVEGLNAKLKNSGASWCAPRRLWVLPIQPVSAISRIIRSVYAEHSSFFELDNLDHHIAQLTKDVVPTYFVEVLDVQIFQLTGGGFAVGSRFDSLIVKAMRRIGATFQKHANAWSTSAPVEKIKSGLAHFAGVNAEHIFVHEQVLLLEDLGAVRSGPSPIQIPAAPPPAIGQATDDDASGDGFLSSVLSDSARVPIDEALLRRLAVSTGLRDYQIDGVRFLVSRVGALLGDDMGLGKTRQSIVAARFAAGFDKPPRILVLCPASLRLNWEREIHAVFSHEVVGMVGEDRIATLYGCHWVIANYERLGGLVKEQNLQFDVMLIDEAHNLKEHHAGRTRNAFILAARINRRYLISGTPLLNRTVELHTLLRLTGHALGRMPLNDFRMEFSGTKERSGALAKRLSNWMIRRRKDVLTGLGVKHRQLRYLSPPEGLNNYNAILRDNSLTVMPKIVKLRQSLEEVKLDFVIETIFSLAPDDKVIVFAEYMSTVEALKAALAVAGIRHVSLVGSDSVRNRQRAVDEFEGNRECRAFITTRAAGGVGITLVSANYVLFASMPWNPALLRQAEDRAYRLGQTRDVYVIIPIIPHTIDEQVWKLLGSKRVLEEDVIEASIHEEEVVESVAAVLQAA